jgi:hypothetical protein
MSYGSESLFPPATKLGQVLELVSLLEYKPISDDLQIANRVGSFFWFKDTDYQSYTGVELTIYRERNGRIRVETRSRAGRSHWDLLHQNRTLKLLRDMLGGTFTTDAGRNRYWRPDGKPPQPADSGCYLARWRFHNALIRSSLYLKLRGLAIGIAQPIPTGLVELDEMNPRLLSNNLLLTYLVAIWEEYCKSTFITLLRYSKQREAVLKGARLTYEQLESIASGIASVEQALGESITLQRPTAIVKHFNLLDQKLDIGGALRKPYRRRHVGLFDSIEALVEQRHVFVHTGLMNTAFSDKKLQIAIRDFEVAVDRVYRRIAEYYGWKARSDF